MLSLDCEHYLDIGIGIENILIRREVQDKVPSPAVLGRSRHAATRCRSRLAEIDHRLTHLRRIIVIPLAATDNLDKVAAVAV
jgi:hypothetical protein